MQEPNNISLYPGTGSVNGCSGDHILIAPAYTVTAQEIQHLVDVTARVIELFFQKHGERYQGKSGGGRAMVGGSDFCWCWLRLTILWRPRCEN